MDQRTLRSPARFLAPLALIAVLVVFLAIVTGSSSNNGASTTDSSSTTATSAAKTTSTKTSAATKTKKKAATDANATYTIQVGDTLGGIADKTGVPLDQLESLNPDVDPHAMVAGQKIKLK
ncbi:MAG: hypothetical protein QOJ29_1220 [Thermoleophilaceae bacterium]|jgi:LysM repeat protein|nr:hypothetical protein [Thermoleophilaceae bacterium]